MKPSLTNYKSLYLQESFGANSFGIHILISTNHDITGVENHAAYSVNQILEDAIKESTAAIDPISIEEAKIERKQLLGLFPGTEFVQDLPNGYCSKGCCKHLPWFRVATRIGYVEIGWRKSVIQIDWSQSLLKTTAHELFPDEDVTKGKHMIHAWSIEKALMYITIILNASNKGK